MTTVDSNKLRDLVRRLHASSVQMQESNKHDPSYCVGWRGATNTYAIELMALIDREAAAQPHQIHVQLQNVERIEHVGVLGPHKLAAVSVDSVEWPTCIDCGQPCSPDRNPLRCLVCQLDADVGNAEAVQHGRCERCGEKPEQPGHIRCERCKIPNPFAEARRP
jgi:hypothetical protein